MLKPLALLQTTFRHVILLDADNSPILDPAFLFDCPGYRETGAVFWPDVGRMEKERPIWEAMGVPYRDEPEFESGQMVIDTVRHREPLELALQMNEEAEVYYHMIWGDKDTFRFAFHKFGRPFAMPPFPLQLLPLPGMLTGSPGVMCQHDFEGNRLFQHRNMAKWDLLGHNPRIPGYLYEEESFECLKELRKQWNGRLHWQQPSKRDFAAADWKARQALVDKLISGVWLIEDRRPTSLGCCGPLVKWGARQVSKPWQPASRVSASGSGAPEGFVLSQADSVKDATGPTGAAASSGGTADEKKAEVDPNVQWTRGLLRGEVAFAADSTLRQGATPQAYWWDLGSENEVWVLYLVNEKGRVAQAGCALPSGPMRRRTKGSGLRIDKTVRIPRLDFPRYVILCPFAAWEARDWPETHWRRLAWLLKQAGYEMVAIGTKKEAERMERTFNKSNAYWAIDHDPEWIMDAMLDAEAVIGLDSGMIHLAGLLQVPAICIHAHLPPEFLFSHAPTVRSVTPATGCVHCRWQEDRGFMEGCATSCSALAVVGPEAVMAELECRNRIPAGNSNGNNGGSAKTKVVAR